MSEPSELTNPRRAGVEFLAGVAVIALLVIAPVAWWWTRDRGPAPQTYRVTAVFDRIGDLQDDAPVTQGGVPIGRVTTIRIVAGTIEVIAQIGQGVPLKQDAVALVEVRDGLPARLAIQPGKSTELLSQDGGARIRGFGVADQSAKRAREIAEALAEDPDAQAILKRAGRMIEEVRGRTKP